MTAFTVTSFKFKYANSIAKRRLPKLSEVKKKRSSLLGPWSLVVDCYCNGRTLEGREAEELFWKKWEEEDGE